MGPRITVGSRVTLHYSITLPDGTVADSSFGEEPLRFTLRDGSLDEGLELALYGLRAGDRQTLTLEPGQAFGRPDPANRCEVPRADFPTGMDPAPGQVIAFATPQGEVAGTVLEVREDTVQVDLNHPLAGLPIVFTVEILAVDPPAPTQQDPQAP